MPTATTTATSTAMPGQGILPLKAPVSPTSPQVHAAPTEATLQSLYARATRAFLHRDVVLTATLIASAFTMLQSPTTPTPDPLDPHRRKWDILRITLESTVYSSAPERDTLPASLRETLLLSPQSFVATAHARSLALFTPSLLPRKPTSAFLPYQILITLVASSMKVECPAVGKELVEDWLANRGQYEFVISTGEAYEKVLELYCLRVLPLLEEWDYAKEFLVYERELSSEKKHQFQTTLETLARAARRSPPRETSTTPSMIPPRSPSPSPSASSSSSSLSTLSTRTAVPLSRADPGPSRLRRRDSASSSASDATVTKRSSSRQQQNTSTSRRQESPSTSIIRSSWNPREPFVGTTDQPPSALALVKTSLRTYFSTNRLATLSILFLLLPVISYLIRLRRVRTISTPASTVDQVKRRLLDARGDSVVRRLWNEVVRAILDTVRMGGGGLV